MPRGGTGQYSFTGLQNGSYHVVAGEDEDGDAEVGVPGRRWSGFTGGTSRLREVNLAGGAGQQASFTLGWPVRSCCRAD